MKIPLLRRIAIVGSFCLWAAWSTVPVSAQSVSDDFSANANWSANGGPPGGSGTNGNLAFANSRLEFTSPSTGTAFCYRMLNTYQGATAGDWSVQVDVHMDNTETWGNLGGEAWRDLVLVVSKAGGLDTRFTVAAERYQSANTSNSFYVSVAGNGTNFSFPSIRRNLADVTFRISYSAASQSLTAWYDPDGAAGGYTWTSLGTLYIGNSVPTGARGINWAMTASDRFAIALLGDAGIGRNQTSLSVVSGQAYFDNFSGTGLTAVPAIDPPTIIRQPSAVAVIAGNPAGFSISTAGAGSVTYQWRKDGTSITGATNANYTIGSAQSADAGSYTCVVTNAGGAVTSNAATLTVTRNYAGTYFGSFDGGKGDWAMLVRNDQVGTFVAYLNTPKSGIVATVAVAADGTFRTASSLLQPQAAALMFDGRNVAAAGVPFTLSGTIGATAVTGSLEGLNAPFTGTQDAPTGATAAVSGLYQAGNTTGTTYTLVGTDRRVLALTIGATLVDGGLGTVNTNGTFLVTTTVNTKITGTVVPTTGGITATIAPTSGPAVTVTGSVTTGLGAPSIVSGPVARSVTAGAVVTLTVTVGGKTPMTYQWKKNGADLAGATNATYSIAAAQVADAGTYTCAVANSDGNATSAPAVVTVAGAARIVNLSILTDIATPGENFTLGYVVGGTGTTGAKPLVIRAAGPSLGALGVPGTLVDPKLEIYAGSTKTGENDNWGGSASLTSAIAAVGAFAFTGPASRDAAIATSVSTPDNSVKVSAVGNGTGAVIAEVYDATPNDAYTATTRRLLNVSVLKQIGGGFTLGFVIGGSGSRSVLIRAVGPGLAGVGVASGTLSDPKLTLFAGSTKTDENDNWGGTATLTAAMAQNGAFAIPVASRDAALLATLQPGQYSARVEGPAGATGLVLVEVYEVP